MKKKRPKIWVGMPRYLGVRYEVFRSRSVPTAKSHGNLYRYVIGPFRTVRGAKFMAMFGENNTHCQCVEDAERLAKGKE
jgi:hypothetical protein